MVNTQELLNKIEKLEKKHEVFIEEMIEKGDKYRMGLRSDNPWWNNPDDYYSTERCNFTEILFGSGNPCPSDLKPFVWKLITSHCQLERIKVQQGYYLNKLSKEKDELTSEVANLTESINHWKPRAENAEQKVKELEVKVEETELKEKTHIEAFEVSERWNKGQKAELREEIVDKTKKLETTTEKLDMEKERADNLQEESNRNLAELTKVREKLEEEKSQSQELRNLLHWSNKPLPKLPSKFKLFKERIKTKFHQLSEKKVKHQKKAMVAQIEVKTK